MSHEHKRQAPPIVTSVRAALMLLQAAQACEMPMPDQIEHLILGRGETQLALYVANLDYLAAWSTWLEEPITVGDHVMDSGRVHCSVDGVMFDHPIRVICMFAPVDEIAVPA